MIKSRQEEKHKKMQNHFILHLSLLLKLSFFFTFQICSFTTPHKHTHALTLFESLSVQYICLIVITL